MYRTAVVLSREALDASTHWLTRTNTWRVPPEILSGSDDTRRGFLNGFFDGDGSVGQNKKRPFLYFFGNSPDGLRELGALLTSFGVEWIFLPRKNKMGAAVVYVYKVPSVRRYLEVVGVTLTRKREQLERGIAIYRTTTRRYKDWAPEELTLMREHYGKLSSLEIGKMLNRSSAGVRWKAIEMGLNGLHPWTQEHDDYLRAHAREPAKQLAIAVGHTEGSVRQRIHQLGIGRAPSPNRVYRKKDSLPSPAGIPGLSSTPHSTAPAQP